MSYRTSGRLIATCLVGLALLVAFAGAAAAQEAPSPDGPPDVTVELGDETISTADEENETDESDDENGESDDGAEKPPEHAGPPEDGDGDGDEESTFFAVENGLQVDEYGGEMHVDCTGDPLEGHACDKGGHLEAELLNFYYDGIMGGPILEWEYWFDDDFDVEVGDEEFTADFDCYEMSFDHLHCAVDGDRVEDGEDDDQNAEQPPGRQARP